MTHGGLVVAALLAVNAVGEPRPGGLGLAQPRLPVLPVEPLTEGQATTIGVIATNARLDKTACLRAAQSGHDGLARALDPVHTAGDGDALVVAATGAVEAPAEVVRTLAAWVVEQAVADAVGVGMWQGDVGTGGGGGGWAAGLARVGWRGTAARLAGRLAGVRGGPWPAGGWGR